MLSKIKDMWSGFEAWVHSWFPGFKTRAMAALGVISTTSALSYQYIQGLPATKYVSQEALTATSAVLFTLSFWFSNMGTRVEAYKEEDK